MTEQYPRGLGRTLRSSACSWTRHHDEKTRSPRCGGAAGVKDACRRIPRPLTSPASGARVRPPDGADMWGGLPLSIVADAVCSRGRRTRCGLEQARQAGAVVTATETVVFQLLGRSDTDAFREISKLLR